MAGDWIKLEKGTRRKPEMYAMSSRLGVSREVIFDRCIAVWEWVDSVSDDGCNVAGATRQAVDECSGITGFAGALESVGWLTVRAEGLHFVNGDRHLSSPAKRRAQTYKRVKRKRNAESVTPSISISDSLSDSSPGKGDARGKPRDPPSEPAYNPAAAWESQPDADRIFATLPKRAQAKRPAFRTAYAATQGIRGSPSPDALIERFGAYYASPQGAGKFWRQPHTLLDDEFWLEPPEAWSDRDAAPPKKSAVERLKEMRSANVE